ncbi:sensor histidine kinase [Mesoterricola silvestris]|uniref:Signal transduction histidine kinase internal region domain-containing protein n=1 Tax=Mesoterricola silvestris TaxID=2927979 RepID=A0AA48H5U6_9BACT|nr:histidine kinase [Mesoterricola silvestris]BDU72408.1 hypothetical protein METEAL_15820 [Mesoterricola silvestris]
MRRNHVGTWVLLFVLAVESVHTIPLRQRYFLRLPSDHGFGWVYLYAILGPLLVGLIYVLCAPMLWTYVEDSRWRYRWNPKGILIAGSACLGMHALDYGAFYWLFKGKPPGSVWSNILFTLGILGFAGFLSTTMNGLEMARSKHRRRADETAKALLDARARLIASQVDPHAMFNILDGAGYLIDEDPELAKTMLDASADYLRKLLKVTKSDSIPLAEERALIQEYLQVQSIRLGDRLRVDWDWPVKFDGVPILPILIQPLVENAINHGIWPSKTGGILSLKSRRKGASLEITVGNTGEPMHQTQRKGATGLENVRQRLALAYGPRASCELCSRDGWTLAIITLPLEP